MQLEMTVLLSPCLVQVYREGKWSKMSTDQLLPGDLVSIGEQCGMVNKYRLEMIRSIELQCYHSSARVFYVQTPGNLI